ncbi:MAG: efflux RND transporter periplasmic adaptor subunit [Gallionella sp.]|nr:efflux RND transporter periplasmic adaptor subunit [Gallionella sp.]MDD4958510.1 efflux RND transporter periplasmic adaptor subunit [Gallionella sp.]
MKKSLIISSITLIVLSATGAGYWLGTQHAPLMAVNKPTSMPKTAEPKILYYRNPMGLPDTSPVPKQDEMGMDYVAVYEGEFESNGAVQLNVEKVQKLGVKTELATLRELDSTLRVTGRVEANERRLYAIAPKFEGWIEKLHVNTTGQVVNAGQALFEVYSPELVSAQREYALAKQGEAAMQHADEAARAGMKQLTAASLARLQNWDMPDVTRDNPRTLTFHSPVTGIVMEKKAVQGMKFGAGETLYQIADLSSVWVLADIAEQDVGKITLGTPAQLSFTAYPGETFTGKVDYLYPTLNPATRTVQVRIELANPKGRLKPALYASVILQGEQLGKVLTVPNSAIIDNGTKQVVLVQLAQGRFEPRSVKLGQRGDQYVEILEGIGEGEQVVTSANFLIDAESNLRAALSGMTAASAPVASQ